MIAALALGAYGIGLFIGGIGTTERHRENACGLGLFLVACAALLATGSLFAHL